ncbi:MAG: phosphoglycerol geranylgeranyltransferase [Euryarchaeota archaeon]
MVGEPGPTLRHVNNTSGGARHAILIDPADQTPEMAAKRCMASVSAGSSMVLVGGSTGTDMKNVHNTVVAIKEALELATWAASQDSDLDEDSWTVPIVLFPAGAAALSPAADGITFMMLMNSTTPKFLIEEQLAGAPFIRQAGVETLPMGYVVCAPGGRVGEVGEADLLEANQTERASAYAMTAEAYGFKLLYLEAGSGATTPVSQELIQAARNSCKLTLIVGGGIRDGQTARKAVQAGADWIVTGNLTESFDDADELQRVLTEFISTMNS